MARRALALLFLLLVACPRGGEDETEKGNELPAVRVASLRRGVIERAVTGTATIESEARVEIIAEAAGRASAVPVEEGDHVEAGQLLCRLDNPRAQVALDRARIELQRVERELSNTARLNERGYVARGTREELEFRHQQAQLEVKRTQEEVRALRVAAPFAGVIARRHITAGAVVSPQRPLFDLVDDQRLIAVLHVPESQVGGLTPGLSVQARLVATGLEVTAEVLRLAPVVDAQSGTQRVTLRVPAREGLRPGMLMTANIVVERKEDALLAPRRALELDALRPSLFVLRPLGDGGAGHRVERLHPKLGIRSADSIELLDAIMDQDRVVVAGQAALRDGLQVRVVDKDTLHAAVPDGGTGIEAAVSHTAAEPVERDPS